MLIVSVAPTAHASPVQRTPAAVKILPCNGHSDGCIYGNTTWTLTLWLHSRLQIQHHVARMKMYDAPWWRCTSWHLQASIASPRIFCRRVEPRKGRKWNDMRLEMLSRSLVFTSSSCTAAELLKMHRSNSIRKPYFSPRQGFAQTQIPRRCRVILDLRASSDGLVLVLWSHYFVESCICFSFLRCSIEGLNGSSPELGPESLNPQPRSRSCSIYASAGS